MIGELLPGSSGGTTEGFTVRPLSLPKDAEQLTELDTSYATDTVYCIEISSSSIALAEEPLHYELRYPLELAEVSRLSQSHHCSVAEWRRDGRIIIVGLAAAEYTSWNKRAILHHLYVAPDFRKRGIGIALLNDVIAYSRATPARCLWLETQNTNYPAIQFYKRCGFTLCGLDDSLYDCTTGTPHQTALFYSLSLA